MLTASALYLMLVNTYFVHPTQAATMTCIAIHESKLKPKAINHKNRNGTKDYGLFQINSIWLKEFNTTEQKMLQIDINITTAIYIYKVQGIRAWAVWKRCI